MDADERRPALPFASALLQRPSRDFPTRIWGGKGSRGRLSFVEFGRMPLRATVLGDRLDPDRARAVAKIWRYRRRETVRPPHLGERIVHAGRGKALWVLLQSGDPHEDVPLLEEVAALKCASLQSWDDLLTRFGLPRREENYLVIDYDERLEGDDPAIIRDSRCGIAEGEKFQLYRIPLERLQWFAKGADMLLAAGKVLLGQYEEASKHEISGEIALRQDDPYNYRVRLAQSITHHALQLALGDLEPFMDWTEERGIPAAWAFYSFGWWPFAVLQELIHRDRHAPPTRCAASDCVNLVPAARLTGRWAGKRKWAHYCSDRCKEREKKRRQRARALRSAREGDRQRDRDGPSPGGDDGTGRTA